MLNAKEASGALYIAPSPKNTPVTLVGVTGIVNKLVKSRSMHTQKAGCDEAPG
jgi:hypothetical protein